MDGIQHIRSPFTWYDNSVKNIEILTLILWVDQIKIGPWSLWATATDLPTVRGYHTLGSCSVWTPRFGSILKKAIWYLWGLARNLMLGKIGDTVHIWEYGNGSNRLFCKLWNIDSSHVKRHPRSWFLGQFLWLKLLEITKRYNLFVGAAATSVRLFLCCYRIVNQGCDLMNLCLYGCFCKFINLARFLYLLISNT